MSLWGGRFQGEMSPVTRDFTVDTSDRRLLRFDIEGSIAHARMLGDTGILSMEEAATVVDGLQRILEEADHFAFSETDEDVHTAVERRLGELVGEVAGKLHTGRSRNDQVALDLRLYLREAASLREAQLRGWAELLVSLAEATSDVLVPTYTHLQQAQVTSFGNHLLAYAWMAVRDMERFADCSRRLNQSPLGSGASAGSTLALDRDRVSAALGMSGPVPNTLDAVASRDFVAEYVFCCAQAMVHLSRLSEELILWASQEFGWLRPGDAVSTGSSALPHKRNPDIAELVRGRAAAVVGDATAILALQKALPLSYNRDLQEDKRIVFHADETLARSLEALSAMVEGSSFSFPVPRPETAALALAERLVTRGVPFREAHRIVGSLVLSLESEDKSLGDADYDHLRAIDGRFEPGDLDVFNIGPPAIDEQVVAIRKILGD